MKELTAEKILQILITIGWSKNQILDALYEIREYDSIELSSILNLNIKSLHNIENYRANKSRYYSVQDYDSKILTNRYELKSHRNTKELFNTTTKHHESENTEIIIKILTALNNNINAKTSEIVEELSTRLEKLTGKEAPPLSKKSLENWLERALNIYTKSELLHVATSISSDRKKNTKIDWSVRNEKKS